MKVKVTADDIRNGEMRDCHNCPVARALARVTKDGDANVYERDFTTYIEVWSRSIQAPCNVVEFVYAFDSGVKPRSFTFDLPEQTSDDWLERCYHCEELYQSESLDDEGVCEECVVKASLCAK